MNVSDHIVGRLSAWGIKTVFGYPGDGINGIMGAFNRDAHGLRFVQVRHEEMAAFMACGHAKFTGEVGVCLATSGPGAIHLLNGLYDAKIDRDPVVAIVGQSARSALGGDYQQEVDLPSLFKDVAREYVHTPDDARFRAPPRRPRRAHRPGRAHRDLHHRPERRPGARRRRTGPRARYGPHRRRVCRARSSCRTTGSSIARPRSSTLDERVAMLVGAGALGAARR